MGEAALGWLRAHQLADGSWGASEPRYYHDRVVCTLAAMIALTEQGQAQDRVRLRRGHLALDTAIQGLKVDPVGEMIGFEMIVPALLAEAEALGIVIGTPHPLRREDDLPVQLARQRAAKLAALPKGMVSRFVTVAFSAEMAGPDGVHLLDVENLQEANGSVGHSPSATTYFILHGRRQDPAALSYLREVASHSGDGGVPVIAPSDVFEIAWVLWNLALADALDDELLSLCQPHLDFLGATWEPGLGIPQAAGYTPKDGDDTGLVYAVLTQFGRAVGVEAVLHWEERDYFRCFALEANPSISANIHILGALRWAGFAVQHPSVQKIMGFLQGKQTLQLFWFDKWHTSPYYPTTHAVIACAGYSNALVEDTIQWILETQSLDGSWGYYMPTAEETAYCLQALTIWKRRGGQVPTEALRRGASWLAEHMEPPYPPLWVGKCLYCPMLVVRSAILSALALVAQGE
jgi:halimadienyl-diphosphate synthase